jgi:hypothetical protein
MQHLAKPVWLADQWPEYPSIWRMKQVLHLMAAPCVRTTTFKPAWHGQGKGLHTMLTVRMDAMREDLQSAGGLEKVGGVSAIVATHLIATLKGGWLQATRDEGLTIGEQRTTDALCVPLAEPTAECEYTQW